MSSMFLANVDRIIEAVLIFIRISGIIFALPIFGDQPVPVRSRILLSVALAFAAAPLMDGKFLPNAPADLVALTILVIKELLIGLFIGFVARVAFVGILMGASIVSYQMGFGTASLLMPGSEAQSDAFTAYHRVFIMVIFLSLNLHQIFLRAIYRTFDLIPAGAARIHHDMGQFLIKITAEIFSVAIQLAAPLLIALLFTMAALGLVSRAVPQMNVFTMSFPASFFVGLMIYIATFTLYPTWMASHFSLVEGNLWLVIRGLSHR